MATNRPTEEDQTVVRLAKTGDRDACEKLAVRYRRDAYILALHLLRNRDDAMDVTQDALLRFFSTIGRFDSDRAVKPWLLRIVRNLAVDLIRNRKRHGNHPFAEDEEGLTVEPAQESPGIVEELEQKQMQKTIWEAVSTLEETYREILLLRDYQDLTYEGIAEILDIPMGTVMSRLHKARKMLRQKVMGLK